MVPIIDTHQHLWDLSRFRLPWLAGGGPLAKSYVTSDYLQAIEGLNVVKAVYMEVDVDPAQHVAEAEYVLDLCQRDDNPTVAAVIGGRPASDGFPAYIERFEGSPYIKGVREVLHSADKPPDLCLEPAFVQGVRRLGAKGLCFDLCMRWQDLGNGLKLVDLCPETRFVLDHCGNPAVQTDDRALWEQTVAQIATRQNVICKISGIVASAKPGVWTAEDLAPIVNYCVEAFGKDRVMFASDWPVCTMTASYRQWVEALQQIVQSWSEAEQRKLFHDNAARFYGLN